MPAPKDPEKYEAWKRKISERTKAAMNTPEMKQKMQEVAESNRGRKQSPESRAKRSEAMKKLYENGDIISPEARARGAEKLRAKRRRVAPRKEKPLPEERKAKQAAALERRGGMLPAGMVKGSPEYEEWLRARNAKIADANKGKKVSSTAKAKMAAAKRGHTSPRKGVTLSEETKKKLSDAHKGKKLSPEQRAKLIGRPSSMKGRTHSEEARAKIREARKHQVITEEMRLKIGAFHKGNTYCLGWKHTEETRKRYSEMRKGKTRSEEAKASFSRAQRKRWEDASEEQRQRWLTQMRNPPTSSIEAHMVEKLDNLGVIYEREKRIDRYFVDFYIPAQNLIIECAGCYWHGCEVCGFNKKGHLEKREQDAKRYETLRALGYRVEVVWEHDLRKEM